jgi:hypothetical protein
LFFFIFFTKKKKKKGMTHQETLTPNLLTLPKPLPTDPVKNNAVIGLTCKRYYEPTKQEKRDGTHIPLKVSVDQENELDNISNASSKHQAHNWESDPLGLCIPDDQNETVSKEATDCKNSQDNNQVVEHMNALPEDGIPMEDIISPIVGTMSRYMTASSEDFDHIDGISSMNSPPLQFDLNPAEPCLMWKNQEPQWLYQDKKASMDAWNAIFHPMSTFQYVKGELEYHNWNPDDVPVTDDLVMQRVSHARLNSEAAPVQTKATLPQIAPTPKPSPVLTIDKDTEIVEEINVNADRQKHYFTMLQNIRAPSHSVDVSFKKSDASSERKSTFFGSKHADEIENNMVAEKHRYWNEKRVFWFGFVCPLLWFYGSITRNSVNKRWQKRCRLAALYFSVVVTVVALVVVVKMAGHAASRQSQSDQIRAVIAN